MVKSVQARRKAQQLARDGQVHQAIEEMRRLLAEAEADPYDHVYLGDLLIRLGQSTEAIDAWLLAVRTYEQAGLNRNAIAVCKKILRLDSRRIPVHRALGDLYVLEGLWSEAVPHFLSYLDGISGEERFGPTFLEALERAASVVGMQVEAALRLSEHYVRVNRGDRAAALLFQLAERVEDSGAGPDLPAELRRRAREAGDVHVAPAQDPEEKKRLSWVGLDEQICVDLESRAGARAPSAPEVAPLPEPIPEPPPALAPESAAPARGIRALSEELLDSPIVGASEPVDAPARAFIVEHFHDPAPRSAAVAEEGSALEPGGGSPDERVWDLDEPDAANEVTAAEADGPSPVQAEAPVAAEAPHGLLERAEEAFTRGDWSEAQRLFERALIEHPLEPVSLGRLVEVARALADRAAEVRYLILLGDAWIDTGEMERALDVFVQVQQLEPENATARRRLSRFQEMGVAGVERIPQPPASSVTEVLNAGAARVTVETAPATGEREWVDLGALLEAFQEGVKNQIAGDDHQSHYDLAVSHRTMGLLEEAVEEADRALSAAGIPVDMEVRARELKGLCLSGLQRHREAVHEFRMALDRPLEDADRRRGLEYALAVALESVGEWQEAAETYERILAGAPGYLDAQARMDRCLRAWVECEPSEETDGQTGERAA